jgi:hypothetical protein
MFDYEGRIFRCVTTTNRSGEVNEETIFHYHQDQDIVWAEYSGGLILRGMLIARVDEGGTLDLRFQHINNLGELRTGIVRSMPEILADGRYRLLERWQWTSGNHPNGESILEEIPPSELLR